MRKFRNKMRFTRKTYYRRKLRRYIIISLLLLLILYISITINNNIRPLLMAMSEVRARVIAIQAINEAIISELTYKIRYEDLFVVKTDKENRITMLQANTMLMNRIASQTALTIQEKLRQIGTKKISIPLGSILGSQVFANYGPRINIGILPAGTVTTDFVTDFEQAGINQTRHKIYLLVKTQVKIILPLTINKVDVVTQVPIAETIIVGDIPQNYIYVPEDEFMNRIKKKNNKMVIFDC